MGVKMGVDFANQRSLPPRGSQGGGVGGGVALTVCFCTLVLNTEWRRVGRSQA